MSVSGHSVCGVRVECVDEVCGAGWDALVVVTVAGPGAAPLPHVLQDFVAAHHELDPASKERGCVSVVRCGRVCGGRLVLSAAGELGPYDDVRSLGEAAAAGVSRCVSCGCRSIVLALQQHARFPRAPLVMLLGALEALYVPLQTRESFPSRGHAVSALGVYGEGVHHVPALVSTASALEVGRTLARDVGGGDPERMTPMRAAEYITKELAGLPHTVVSVLDDADQIARRYPLLAAVSRAADTIDRHRGCVVYVEYAPPQYDRTLMLVGKGVTYDTGGCDIKAGGAMAGMSRDKCGAAAIAGLVKSVALLSGRVRVRAWLGLVRNSVGAAAYVADELLTSRGTLPVRVGNTDAEGRLVMADLLHEAREAAAGERAGTCHVYTVATLTGHAARAAGAGYSIVMDNHVARDAGHAGKMQRRGDELGDMIEVSTIRREDLAAHAGRCAGDALHQADNKPSTQVPRGHQGPAGFLLRVSGFDSGSVPYSHVDIAASAGELPHNPTAAPLLALAGIAGVIDG